MTILRGSALLVLGYHLALLAVAMVRFRQIPDYVRLHPWHDNVWSVFTGFPTLESAVPVALREPWIEIGRSVPDLPMAEWSVQVLPPNLLVVSLVASLLALHWKLARRGSHPAAAAFSAGGGVGTALAATSLTWIACCSSPSWVVLLAMLGLWIPTALSLDHLGPVIGAAGLLLIGLGLFLQRFPSRLLRLHRR